MKISKAAFVGSIITPAEKPNRALPEFAFIGRSNVGKSSLINMLCKGATEGKELARTSASPGKTITINYFLIDNKWYLVDMPGYGYAKLPVAKLKELATMNNEFINKSKDLATLFVLLDLRLPLQKSDLNFLISTAKAQIPVAIVFTKKDKLAKNRAQNSVNSIKTELLNYWEELPPCFITSSRSGEGREELISYIGNAIKIFKEETKK